MKTAEARPLPDVNAMPFEQALQELEQIVQRLESGNVSLEDSIEIYQRGEVLRARCAALLQRAEARIETISVGADGKAAGVMPLDPER